jgi:hypothetical protein
MYVNNMCVQICYIFVVYTNVLDIQNVYTLFVFEINAYSSNFFYPKLYFIQAYTILMCLS